MMSGAGSIKHMIDSYKANRNLLKRRNTGKYKNFDTSYITDYPVTGKKHRIPSYKNALPEYLIYLKNELSESKEITKRKDILSMSIAAIVVILLAIILF